MGNVAPHARQCGVAADREAAGLQRARNLSAQRRAAIRAGGTDDASVTVHHLKQGVAGQAFAQCSQFDRAAIAQALGTVEAGERKAELAGTVDQGFDVRRQQLGLVQSAVGDTLGAFVAKPDLHIQQRRHGRQYGSRQQQQKPQRQTQTCHACQCPPRHGRDYASQGAPDSRAGFTETLSMVAR